jgi:hypothetical protein
MSDEWEYSPVLDTGNGVRIVLSGPNDLVQTLSRYNGERSRGLVHTPEWQAAMAELQRRFDEAMGHD